jgi:N-acyl-D-aspartate/D-glutamate deacylase
MIASIVTSFSGHINDGTQYATALEYIDAFVEYIAVLNNDLGAPVGDSIAYVMGKYGEDITDNENSNMAAFLATRLESGEVFGN